MSHIDTKIEVGRIAASASVFTIFGLTATDAAAIATAVYMLIQILVLMPKAIHVITMWYKQIKRAMRDEKNDSD